VQKATGQNVAQRKYLPEEVQDVIAPIKQAYDVGLIDVDQFLSDFKFKDQSGRYWTIGIQSGDWYCYTQQGWVVSGKPAGRLEGTSNLSLEAIPRSKTKIVLEEPAIANSLLNEVNRTTGLNFSELPKAVKFLLDSYVSLPKPKETPPIYCVECGSKLKPQSKFCTNCGSSIAKKSP